MGTGTLKLELGHCIFVLLALSHIFGRKIVDGRSISTRLAEPEGTIRTIKSEDGDVIDCVDIYKQPAFNHPLLKNHTIQMKPNSYPSKLKVEKLHDGVVHNWLNTAHCPHGTVPIRRTQKHNRHLSIPLIPDATRLNRSFDVINPPNHEYAQVSLAGGNYFGAHASINVWNPVTYDGEFSLAQIWVVSGQEADLNTVEAGWIAYSGDKKTKFFTYWTRDNYQKTGCYNLDCPGFVQTNSNFAFGGAIEPVSTYNGKPYEIAITIHKDQQSGNWWLRLQDQDLGYWPSSIFTGLADSSTVISWGGEIINSENDGRHTSTQMGSGHFPSEGYGKAAFFKTLGYIDGSGTTKDPESLIPYVTKSSCYDLLLSDNKNTNYGTYFFFGGPGYSDKCP